jgi:hypothetical protein
MVAVQEHYYEVGDSINIQSINLTFSIEQVYEDIEFIVDESDQKP